MAISQKIKKEYSELKEKLNKHNYLYHNQDAPEISDQEYDSLYKALIALEENYPNLKSFDSFILFSLSRIAGISLPGSPTLNNFIQLTFDTEVSVFYI